MDTSKGSALPLGVSPTETGVNFALTSHHASHVSLYLYEQNGTRPFAKIPLRRNGDVWYVEVHGLPTSFEYTYRCHGPYDPEKGHLCNSEMDLVDPYAKKTNANDKWGEWKTPPRALFEMPKEFDWENDSRPLIPENDLIIYEMHVRSFTWHSSSGVTHPGTFRGVEEKIPYLKKLGINAIELMPIHEFNETENLKTNPKTKQRLYNYWGYSTAQFFSPMRRYGTDQDLKHLVKACHKHGIEVILDVVYNHTCEGNNRNYYHSFRGIDNEGYYLTNKDGYMNYSGCGNTLKCQHSIVQNLIIDSLRYWVSEYHIDGFRFDLASILTRDENGNPMERPPLIDKITRDPILGPTKLIAEPWDSGGLDQVGKFPSWKFSEWNGKYRDGVRRFIKGKGSTAEMKNCLLGSPDLYEDARTPLKSINFITVHDGFTMHDLVSYEQKHNEENGENNQDGAGINDSWNCGIEGQTNRPEILALRQRQMRNFFVALFISQGIPLLLMGDEYGHTRHGNNNSWCHDSELNYFLWDELENHQSLFRFVQKK